MDSFGRARKLADLGRLSEAADECERLLLTDKANSGAYCLLGTVLHGMGNLARAEECFTRAIYLDERCYDAVMHLSLIKEHRGDLEGAEILRRRAARIQPQTRTM
jgi:chemotaxis protein methyltransferase WspC